MSSQAPGYVVGFDGEFGLFCGLCNEAVPYDSNVLVDLQAAIDAHRCPPEPPNCPGCGRRMVCRRNDDDGATFECQCGGRFTTLNRGQLHLGVIDPR